MEELIQIHKNKIIIALPIFLLFFIILGGFYISSLPTGELRVVEEKASLNYDLALKQFENLDIKAKAFVVYDADKRKVIYSKNELAQLPLASLTKVMSAIVALDLADRETIIDVKIDNNYNPNDRYALTPGKWKLGDLLRLTLISSSNSGINVISEQLSPRFVELMGRKAEALGLRQTYFLNESGLDINESLAGAYGSPLDMARLFDYALENNSDILGATKYNSISINSTEGYTGIGQNTNQNVSQIKELVASKTGFTDLAQGNLAIAFDINQNTRVVVVVMGSTQDGRFSDAEILTKAVLAYYSLL